MHTRGVRAKRNGDALGCWRGFGRLQDDLVVERFELIECLAFQEILVPDGGPVSPDSDVRAHLAAATLRGSSSTLGQTSSRARGTIGNRPLYRVPSHLRTILFFIPRGGRRPWGTSSKIRCRRRRARRTFMARGGRRPWGTDVKNRGPDGFRASLRTPGGSGRNGMGMR